MSTGPFDGRKKRSRCQACVASHLKCSGQAPCANCERRRIVCVFGQAQNGRPLILVGRGKQVTLSDWRDQSSRGKRKLPFASAAAVMVAGTANARPSPLSTLAVNDELCYLSYFDVFARSNSFNGKKRTMNEEVKKYALFHSGKYFKDAMLALGALQAVKLGAQDIPFSVKQALTMSLEYYSKSIVGLRVAIDARGKNRERGEMFNTTVLWTTLFLGLFELMSEGSGQGWSQHMVHGTTRALEASGPSSCRSEPGRGFFIQAKVFEVSRTILFNETSFLTQPEWMTLSREMWSREVYDDEDDEWSPLDSLLDIMVMCSRLCSVVRIRRDTMLEIGADGQPSAEARSVCADGHLLREALSDWYASYGAAQGAEEDEEQEDQQDASMLLSRIFFAAISIYLSGIFDYGITCWQRLNLMPSTLSEPTLQKHAETILRLTAGALDGRHDSNCSRLSPLLFLFPLRIAGARVRLARQRDEVARLVGGIAGVGFAAAAAVREDLEEVWGVFGVGSLATDRKTLEYS